MISILRGKLNTFLSLTFIFVLTKFVDFVLKSVLILKKGKKKERRETNHSIQKKELGVVIFSFYSLLQ